MPYRYLKNMASLCKYTKQVNILPDSARPISRSIVAAKPPRGVRSGQYQIFVWDGGQAGHMAVRNIDTGEYISHHGGTEIGEKTTRTDVRGHSNKKIDVTLKESKTIRSLRDDVILMNMRAPSSSHIVTLPLLDESPTSFISPTFYRIANSSKESDDHSNCVDAVTLYLSDYTSSETIKNILNTISPDPKSAPQLATLISAVSPIPMPSASTTTE